MELYMNFLKKLNFLKIPYKVLQIAINLCYHTFFILQM